MARTVFLKKERYLNRTQRYTNGSGSDIEAGTPVKIDISSTQCIAGVTLDDIDNGDTGMVDVGNVYAYPCGAAQTFEEGDVVAWNNEGSNAFADAYGIALLPSLFHATTSPSSNVCAAPQG